MLTSCGVLVFRREPRLEFLLMIHPTRLDLPKGHVDPGETEIECALRELWEETSIPADAIELDPNFRFTLQYPVRSKRTGGEWADKILVIFLGWLQRPVEIQVSEHGDYRWVPWQPPHTMQTQTIDPLLAVVAEYLAEKGVPK